MKMQTLLIAFALLACSTSAATIWFPQYSNQTLEMDNLTKYWAVIFDGANNQTVGSTASDGERFLTKDMDTSLNLSINVSLDASNRAGIKKNFTLDGGSRNLTPYSNGAMLLWVYLPNASQMTSVRIRIGQASGKYNEYTNTQVTTGWMIYNFTLSTPTAQSGGGADLSNINYTEIHIYYGASQTNTWALIDSLLASQNSEPALTGSTFSDAWEGVNSRWVYSPFYILFPDGNTPDLTLSNTNNTGAGYHARAVSSQQTPTNFTYSALVKIWQINQMVRIGFDWEQDGSDNNMSSAYFYAPTGKFGIENIIHNSSGDFRNYTEISYPITYDTYYNITIIGVNDNISAYINGALMLTTRIPRKTGTYVLEAFHAYATFNEVSYSQIYYSPPTWTSTVQNLFSIGLGAVFGTNLLLIGVFFLLFGVWITQRMGAGTEFSVGFGIALIFLLTIASPGLLPGMVWTATLLVVGLIIFVAVKRIQGGY